MRKKHGEDDGTEESPPELKIGRKAKKSDLLGGLGLSLDLQDCFDEFNPPGKVLPFVRPEKPD